jgi:L-gulonolactone oxidase
MEIEELQAQAAWAGLTDAERAAVVDRLDGHALDVRVVAAQTGDVGALEADDLRHWLAMSATRPFAALTPGDRPTADALFGALLAAAPGIAEGVDRGPALDAARAASRAFAAADAARALDGLLRDEELGALAHHVDELEDLNVGWAPAAVERALRAVGLGALADALAEHGAATRGLRGMRAALQRQLETHAFDLARGGMYVTTGAAGHEGHFVRGEWRSWTGAHRVRPAQICRPRTEEELCAAVAGAERLRVVGGGHSFNSSPLCAHTLLSLDACDRLLHVDSAARLVRVQAGIRLRDLNRALAGLGLALPVMGSTDAQSLGGLIATDLHGTGRDRGFLSEQLRSLRIIDADGVARTARPGDPLFHAACGGLGACGVVCEVELALVPDGNLRKTAALVDRAGTEQALAQVLAAHEHISFYYVGGTDGQALRQHSWDRVAAPPTEGWLTKQVGAELKDFALSAFVPGLAEGLVNLDEDHWLSDLAAPDSAVVLPAGRAFGRRLFYRHDEIEHGLPMDAYLPALRAVLDLLARRDFFSIVETRFTPDTSQGLLGPGAGRPTAYIELATPMSQDRGAVYPEVEAILRDHGGQPHLGKATGATAADLLAAHGERFRRFQAVREAQDPQGKFLNGFTQRVFVG